MGVRIDDEQEKNVAKRPGKGAAKVEAVEEDDWLAGRLQ